MKKHVASIIKLVAVAIFIATGTVFYTTNSSALSCSPLLAEGAATQAHVIVEGTIVKQDGAMYTLQVTKSWKKQVASEILVENMGHSWGNDMHVADEVVLYLSQTDEVNRYKLGVCQTYFFVGSDIDPKLQEIANEYQAALVSHTSYKPNPVNRNKGIDAKVIVAFATVAGITGVGMIAVGIIVYKRKVTKPI